MEGRFNRSRVLYVGVGEWVFCVGVCVTVSPYLIVESAECRYPLVSLPGELRQEQGQVSRGAALLPG